MLTALTAKQHLSAYAGSNNDFYERLGLVCERYLKNRNARGSKQMIALTIYTDVDGHAVVTLPRQFNTILAGNIVRPGTALYNLAPLRIQNPWYANLPGGPGIESNLCIDSFVPINDRVTTFRDWTTAMYLRFKFEQTEAAGKILVRGVLAGTQIYSTDDGNYIEGIAVSYSGSTTVTTTQQFDLPPYGVIKPETKGRVWMYTWDGTTETLVAVYDPTETLPAWRRYRVPSCTNSADNPTYIAVVKKEWLPIVDDNQVLPISNLGAIRNGLEALQCEDAKDRVRAKQLWQDGKELLSDEAFDDEGAGAIATVQIDDFLDVASIGCH
jgi:hypothetical protein